MDKAQIAQDLTRKIFDFISSEVQINTTVVDGRIRVNVTVPEAGFLIGRDGENLRSFQYILALMIGKETGDFLSAASFVFDINNYQKEREDYLTALAKNTAYRVIETKRPEELPPMPPAERKIIHLTIEQIGGVKSESVGDGEERRVIISQAS